ncbi:MAG: hypothetical protein N2748_06360, partial [candidate division WOR-3 bacterium]|nr:hypothetical protein [candidate division WOR-3 bacterium]
MGQKLLRKNKSDFNKGERGEICMMYNYLINKNIQIDWQMVSRKMAIYPNWKDKAIKETLIQAIKNFNDSELRMDLRPFLPRPESETLIPILKKELLKIL